MSRDKKILTLENVTHNIWTNCCVRSTTTQQIYIERAIKNLLKQIRDEIEDNLWNNKGCAEDNINEVFNKYIK